MAALAALLEGGALLRTGGSADPSKWIAVPPAAALLSKLSHVVFDQDGVIYAGEKRLGNSDKVVTALRRREIGVTFAREEHSP